ncbi:MAG: 3-hydroxyacyl-CoA dehydrogenase [Ilumatobacter coccineus]|uniref:3-hydroxyacyl-CoA dehydrogenase n=1 Tax=Ilumatobacter coccineus TaxID=467094 RepID=A0A2G6KDN2_9ACTN|nr:MAG: 3-hydroxyacyl-CoA dehydrogenase [Ilumatobacter coccineus]
MPEITESVRIERDGDVALLIINNPPVNVLSWHVRQGIFDGVDAAVADGAKAIVLICDGRTFIAGADISEFGAEMKGATLEDAQAKLENSPVPVVAAIHGTALGGGLETALCTNYRVALSSAKFGLPEVHLGILPGGGGTQRLPRLVGVPKALDMVTSGRHVKAPEAAADGLIDEMVEGGHDELKAAAVAFANRAITENLPLVKVRDLDDKLAEARGNEQLFADFRKKIARKTRGFLAPEYNIQCIEAAVAMPFDEGLAHERKLFIELLLGEQSAAQRYYFFSERAANKVPSLPADTAPLNIEKVGVLGAGTMGGGIAMNFANIGIPVTIVERDQESLDRGLAVVKKNYERSRTATPESVAQRMSMITGSTDKADFADCDLVIEAVFENMALKKQIFAELDTICKPEAIMASNTSFLDIDEIAAATSRPENVIGMHFFSPANVMRLLEIIKGEKSSPTAIATAMAIGKKIRKVAVLSGVCDGFIGNRMLAQRAYEADQLVLEGATPAQVDMVVYNFGFPMGPFAMYDLAGLDIGWDEETSSSSTIREILCEQGRKGQKTGGGFYDYSPDSRMPIPNAEVEQMIRDFAAKKGIEQRQISDEEILERCMYPLVNEGAKILEEKIALRGSDIDVVWVNGYGWPVYTGGPMYWADKQGLDKVVERIRHYSDTVGGEYWKVSPLLERLAEEGGALQMYAN